MFQVHEQKGSMPLGLNNGEQFSFLLRIQQEEWLVQSQFPFQQAPYVRLTYLIKKSLIIHPYHLIQEQLNIHTPLLI